MVTNFSLILLMWWKDNSSLTSSNLCRSSSSCESLRERQLWAAIFDCGGQRCDHDGNRNIEAFEPNNIYDISQIVKIYTPYSCHVFLYPDTGSAGLRSVFGCNSIWFRTRVRSSLRNRNRHWNVITCSINRWTHPSESLQCPEQNIRQSNYNCESILCVFLL